MLTGSAAGSFADDIMKWQKRLQTIESVLSVWLEVQEKWIELEDVSKECEGQFTAKTILSFKRSV